jgi:hypothetical protein
MERICLVEAGNYLLGIGAAAITRKLSVDSFVEEDCEHETSLIALAPFFDQDERPLSQAERFVVEVKTSAEPLTLVLDSILGEIEAPGRFEAPPLLYPELARCCCPQMITHNGQPVLLLDEDGLDGVRARLKSDYGAISLDSLRDESRSEIMAEDTPALSDSTDVKLKQPSAKFNGGIFKTIVSWTIGEYLGRGSDKSCVISSAELPPEYIQQGVSNEVLQGLIDRTVQKCGKLDDAALQRLREKSGAKP